MGAGRERALGRADHTLSPLGKKCVEAHRNELEDTPAKGFKMLTPAEDERAFGLS